MLTTASGAKLTYQVKTFWKYMNLWCVAAQSRSGSTKLYFRLGIFATSDVRWAGRSSMPIWRSTRY